MVDANRMGKCKMLEPQPVFNPLLNDLILDKVFQFFSSNLEAHSRSKANKVLVTNLLNFRLVCKEWNERATPILRAASANKITFGCWKNRNWEYHHARLSRFIEIVKRSTIIPFQSYDFQENVLNLGNQNILEKFLDDVGPTAVELNFYFDEETTLAFSQNGATNYNLERLETLKITFCTGDLGFVVRTASDRILELFYFVRLLIESAPKLREFKFGTRGLQCEDGIENLVQELFMKLPDTIKKIYIRFDHISDFHFNLLAQANMKLEECELISNPSNLSHNSESVQNFFKKHSETLKSLVLDWEGWSSRIISNDFPQLTKLQRITIVGDIGPLQLVPKLFPNLVFLNIKMVTSSEEYVKLVSGGQQAASVEELFLPVHLNHSEYISKAARCFPNIKKLHVVPFAQSGDDKTLEEIFTNFTGIEELSITCHRSFLNGDSILSGIPRQKCKELVLKQNFCEVDIRKLQCKPSLLNLAKLKKLKMRTDASFSNLSAHLIFLNMPSLEELNIEGSKITPDYEEKLKLKLRKVKLYCHAKDNSSSEEDVSEFLAALFDNSDMN